MQRQRSPLSLRLAAAACLAAVASMATAAGAARPARRAPAPPAHLSDTGLYAGPSPGPVAPGVLAYVPQYPLWSDGATKRRWVRLPPGTAIDASDPDAWGFPAGTRLWKEFSFGGRRVETRYMELGRDGAWRYATYLWNAGETDAALAPERGVQGAVEVAAGVRHDVPGVADCRACHEAAGTPVLGFGALQLSPDRDPLAPHAEPRLPGDVDLPALAARGLLRGLPPELLRAPPRVAAPTPRARAALGYLHANCASCHDDRGILAGVGLSLRQRVAARPEGGSPLPTAVGQPSRFRLPGAEVRIAPGAPEQSVVVRRMASRSPLSQMPPLGTHLADRQALDLVAGWIREELQPAMSHAAPTR